MVEPSRRDQQLTPPTAHIQKTTSFVMTRDQEARIRRDYVANMYPGPSWKTKVAHMPTDQITAIYLRFIREPATPEILERHIRQTDHQNNQLSLF